MRHRGRTALAALVAVFALGAVASASALAAPPEFRLKTGEKFPSKIEGLYKGSAGFESSYASLDASCSTDKSTGEITSAKAVSLTFEWTGCATGKTSEHSQGAPAGDIVIPGSATLVAINETEHPVGILFTLKETRIEAEGNTITLSGSVLIPITPINTETTKFKLAIDQESPGVPKYSRYENGKGEVEYAALMAKLDNGGFQTASMYLGAGSSDTTEVTSSKELTVSTAYLAPPAWLTSFGSEGKASKQFSDPQDAAVAANDNVYVVDTGNNRVEEFSEGGKTLVAEWGSAGTAAGQFKHPIGIAIAPNGNVYVADAENERVQEFTASGAFVQAIGFGVSNGKDEFEVCTSSCQAGVVGGGEGQFGHKSALGWEGPEGVAAAPNGHIYVTDTANRRVEEFGTTGRYVKQFGASSAYGELAAPRDVAVSAEGNVYVTDEGNARVDEYSENAETLLRQWGSQGGGNGQFRCPAGITVASNADVYVADECNDRVQAFTTAGEYLTQWGSPGSKEGQFSSPSGVAVSANGEDVYVVDQDNSRLQEFDW